MESLSYDISDERNHRGGESGNPKKRLNQKEQRERRDQIEKRTSQREGFLRSKADEEAAKRMEELNAELGLQRKREEEEKRQSVLARREEQRQLFQEAMLKDAIGEAPSSQDAKKIEAYDQRKKAFQQGQDGSRPKAKQSAASASRAALLKSMAAQLNGS